MSTPSSLRDIVIALSFLFMLPAAGSAVAEDLKDGNKWQVAPLVSDASRGFFLIEVKIGERQATLLLDTGAAITALSLEGADRLGLEISEAPGEARGVGGKMKKRRVSISGMAANGIDFDVDELTVLPLGLFADTRSWGGFRIDGVLGSDLLRRHQMLVDINSGQLAMPVSGGGLVADLAREAGYQSIPFIENRSIPLVPGRIAEDEISVLLDTGASALLLDDGFRKEKELPKYGAGAKISGAAGAQASGQTYVANLRIGDAQFANNGADIMDLSVFPEDFQVLAGVDYMLACNLIFSYGDRSIFLMPKKVAAQDMGVAGPMIGTQEALSARVNRCKLVATGQVMGFAPGGKLKNAKGEEFQKITFRYRLRQVLVGDAKPGDTIDFAVAVPMEEADIDHLRARSKAEEFGLLFLRDAKGPTGLKSTLMKSSAIRLAQIKGVAK